MVNNSTNINKTGKRPRQVLAWDRHKNVTVLNQLMGSQPFSSCKVWIKQNIAKWNLGTVRKKK